MMDVYAPAWEAEVDSIRVLMTQIGLVQMAVKEPAMIMSFFQTFPRTSI